MIDFAALTKDLAEQPSPIRAQVQSQCEGLEAQQQDLVPLWLQSSPLLKVTSRDYVQVQVTPMSQAATTPATER